MRKTAPRKAYIDTTKILLSFCNILALTGTRSWLKFKGAIILWNDHDLKKDITHTKHRAHDAGRASLIRPRINALLANASNSHLVIVCAGMGCGKTRAVADFTLEYGLNTAWMQLSESDNVSSCFWENYTNAMAQLSKPLARELAGLGFPDTEDKINQFMSVIDRHLSLYQNVVLVMDDFHVIKTPAVIQFLEYRICHLPPNRSLILICREFPQINIGKLQIKGHIPVIGEELNFTESEISQYMRQIGLSVDSRSLREIFKDTNGWAFYVDLVAWSLRKAPGYVGYVQNVMKHNIFNLMEKEMWEAVSERLRHFWVRLSLVDNLPAELVVEFASGDESLLSELNKESAYIRFDSYTGAYRIHHLFLDFLRAKQNILTNEEMRETYKKSADWCKQNDFKVCAIKQYANIGDYESIVSILSEFTLPMPPDIAHCLIELTDSVPPETFDRVAMLAVVRVNALICLGRWDEALDLMAYYEAKFMRLPENDVLRNRVLSGIYYSWGKIRALMSTTDECYDSDIYYCKMIDCIIRNPLDSSLQNDWPFGLWFNMAGSSKKGAPEEYIKSLARIKDYFYRQLKGLNLKGTLPDLDDFCRGELLFYQGSIQAAEPIIIRMLERSREERQLSAEYLALLYIGRIAVFQGDYAKAEQSIKDTEARLDEQDYPRRFINYDMAIGWYYCVLRQPEMVPDWLKKNFAPYSHAYFIENCGNLIKARYCYLTKNYTPLLKYIGEMKQREAILYGRVEMLAMEACIRYLTKDKTAAFAALEEAYETASPNNIMMPFIELGKDMRTLTSAVLRGQNSGIPKLWLEDVNRNSSLYAKHQSILISNYKKTNGIKSETNLSPRETEVLQDLYRGLSRLEIAAKQNLSINTINLNINKIYKKLNAHSVADVVRIAAEQNLIW